MEASNVWLLAIGALFGALGLAMVISRWWQATRQSDLGWVSQQWLAEHRAGHRS